MQVGYWSGEITGMIDDMQLLKPTYFAGVPRVYQKFNDRVKQQVEASNFIRRSLFNRAYKAKEASVLNNEEVPGFYEKLVFSKVKERFGGCIETCMSGSAPLTETVGIFLKVCFTDVVGEGYGLTETCAAGTTTDLDDWTSLGKVGSVVSSVEIKLIDVPDMNYLTSDEPCPRGEIWIRGNPVFKGYYKQPDVTREVLFEDGWFATGDIGKWRLDGKLQIIDRRKNIFKLAQGEYIRPEYIEGVYKQSPFIGSIFVHGNSDETYLVAIISPDFETVVPWAKQNNIQHKSLKELCSNPLLHSKISEEMNILGNREKLTGFEKVKKICVGR